MLNTGPVVYNIYVNNQSVTQPINNIQVMDCFGKHEIVVVTIGINTPVSNAAYVQTWPDGAPIQMMWGASSSKINVWYGYVNHSEYDTAGVSSTQMAIRYVLIGTSMPMNSDATRTWKNVSPSYMARKIAREHNLRSVCNAYAAPVDYEAQASESDFEFLNRMADKIGWRFWVQGGTLYFQDPNVLYYGASQYSIPNFVMSRNGSTMDTVLSFKMMKGGNIPGSVNGQYKATAIDESSNKIITATSGTGTSVINRVMANSSYHDANKIVSGQTNLKQYWVTAQARLSGNAALFPGKAVNLQGSAFIDSQSGIWLVTSATHTLQKSMNRQNADVYYTDVTLVRNTEGTNQFREYQQVNPELITCTLNPNNQWISADLSEYIDGKQL